MAKSKLIRERIRRVRILFKELGYDLFDGELYEESYSSGFSDKRGFHSGFFVDNDSRFLELVFTFSFSQRLGAFIQNKLEEMLLVCYEFGCYLNIRRDEESIEFSVFSKIYYAGLNYFSLKETLVDFKECVETLKGSISLQGEIHENT